jgi:hypothetical protein
VAITTPTPASTIVSAVASASLIESSPCRRAICEHAERSSSERSSSSFFYPIGFLRDFDAIFASDGINIHDGPVCPIRDATGERFVSIFVRVTQPDGD